MSQYVFANPLINTIIKKKESIIEFGHLILNKNNQEDQRFYIPFCLNSFSFQKLFEVELNIIAESQ